MTAFASQRIARIHRDLQSHLPSEPEFPVKALENRLMEKGLVNTPTIDACIGAYGGERGYWGHRDSTQHRQQAELT